MANPYDHWCTCLNLKYKKKISEKNILGLPSYTINALGIKQSDFNIFARNIIKQEKAFQILFEDCNDNKNHHNHDNNDDHDDDDSGRVVRTLLVGDEARPILEIKEITVS